MPAIFSWFLLAALVQADLGPPPFESPRTVEEMRGKQAVVETTLGAFVIELLPDAAPNHVGLFMQTAEDGGYVGTAFHYVVRYGVIQGGDPLTRDPDRVADYGQGGLNLVVAEPNDERHTAGAVSTVADPTRADSGGVQFFVCATDQPTLDGQYVVFGRVVEGLEVVQAISAVEADADGRPLARVEITGVTIRDTPVEPFVDDSAEELAAYQAVLETTMGTIRLDVLPDVAPETVRQFLRLADAGVYDGILVHRVAPNFVVQTGALSYRESPLTVRQQALVHDLAPEFSDTPTLPGVVAMAHGDDPASGSTSFFICIGECRALDGKYTAFARVTGGMDTLCTIETVPREGESPRRPIVVTRVRVERK